MAIERLQLSSTTLLRELMKANKLSQKGLAAKVGCDQSLIAFLVTGRRGRARTHSGRVNAALATRIAEVLGVQLDRLFMPIVSGNTRRRPSDTRRKAADDRDEAEAA